MTADGHAAALVTAVRNDPAGRLELAAGFYDRRAGAASIRSYRRAELARLLMALRRAERMDHRAGPGGVQIPHEANDARDMTDSRGAASG